MTVESSARAPESARTPMESGERNRFTDGQGELSRQLHRPENNVAPVALRAGHADASRALEQKGILPSLTVTNDGHHSSALPRKDWTVAVHLGATLPGDKENPSGFGSERQLAELKRMARDTEGKSVNFMVHVERPVDSKGRVCDSKPGDGDKKAACFSEAVDANRQKTERYLIHDGKIDRLPDAKYKTAADNVAGLLQEAGRLAPSERIGLFVQSHGQGTDGISTNQGEIPLKKTVETIDKGLKGSGHDKLDLLNFNSCDMATATVLDKVGQVAKNVVASAATELGTKTNDGQNMPAAFQALMQNPQMSGKELGEKIVQQSAEGKSGEGRHNAIQTLANFDMSRYSAFKGDLDQFGRVLAGAAADPKNLKVIKETIDKTPVPETGEPGFQSNKRDVKAFANNILEAVKEGKFKGDTAEIERSAQGLLKSYDAIATAQFGEKAFGYEKLGGLTINLPGKEITDSRETARLMSPFHQLGQSVKEMQQSDVQLSDRFKLNKEIKEQVQGLRRELGPAAGMAVSGLERAQRVIERAKTVEEMRAGVEQFQRAADSADNSRVGRMVRHYLADDAREAQREYRAKARKEQVTPGWDAFLDKLYRHMR